MARHAAEWNYIAATVEAYREKAARVDELCRAAGRDPRTVKRSIMSTYVVGRDRADLLERAAELGRFIPGFRGLEPADVVGRMRFAGTPAELVGQMRPWIDAGVQLFMLQHLLLDDSEQLRLLAEAVLPAL